MKQIVSVRKIDVVKDLPKMFQERTLPTKMGKKRTPRRKENQ